MITDEKIEAEIERAEKVMAFYKKFLVSGCEYKWDKKYNGDSVNVTNVAVAILDALDNHNAYKIGETSDSSISLFVDFEVPTNRGESTERTHTSLILWTDTVNISIIFTEDSGGEDYTEYQKVKTIISGQGIGLYSVTVEDTDNPLYAAAIKSAHHFILDKIIAFLDNTDA